MKNNVWIVYTIQHGFKVRLGTVRGNTEQAALINSKQKFGDKVSELQNRELGKRHVRIET